MAGGVFDISKIQIQKQITTSMMNNIMASQVYLIFQRYKFKSKSQPQRCVFRYSQGVFDISKIQIQKQITTNSAMETFNSAVYLIFQRYKFKSKSQPSEIDALGRDGCI